jgi:hypothetical protein
MKIEIRAIPNSEAEPWILKKHYAKRMCSISYAFGAFDGTEMKGVVTYGLPASPHLCRGICGKAWTDKVIELNRLCCENVKGLASQLVGASLRMLPRPTIVVSYADSAQGHVGYIYQATNFIYTGAPKAHDNEYIVNGKKTHARTLTGNGIKAPTEWARQNNIEIVKPKPKHRYLFFCASKTDKKKILRDLRYKPMPYPKGESARYDASAQISTQTSFF